LLPTFDQALGTLLADLDDRGLLDETLVVALGEMGRTPQANATWGRGHWSTLFPAVLAGGGIRRGTVYGASDKDAGFPIDRPVTPEDLAATIYHALGIDPHVRLNDAQGRPTPIIEEGRALVELFG
jgi:arylsulfatase A-like enzyme